MRRVWCKKEAFDLSQFNWEVAQLICHSLTIKRDLTLLSYGKLAGCGIHVLGQNGRVKEKGKTGKRKKCHCADRFVCVFAGDFLNLEVPVKTLGIHLFFNSSWNLHVAVITWILGFSERKRLVIWVFWKAPRSKNLGHTFDCWSIT